MKMTWLVLSFNRHFFAMAIAACLGGLFLMRAVEVAPLRWFLAGGVFLAAWFILASIVASFLVYDASDLYRMTWWPSRCLPRRPDTGVVVHAGFDPASSILQRRFPDTALRVFDFFDPRTTTEASIQHAHRTVIDSPSGQPIAFDRWPVPDASQQAVFVINAAHELRRDSDRQVFFSEASRVLGKGGRIIVVEQIRDAANFACFGVAAFHFLSRRTWLKTFRSAALQCLDEFRISPFARCFVLGPELHSPQHCQVSCASSATAAGSGSGTHPVTTCSGVRPSITSSI